MRAFLFIILTHIFFSCVEHDLTPKDSDCAKSDLMISRQRLRNASSCEIADGIIDADATGGVPPYSFTLNSESSSDGLFEDLQSGVYSVTVTDAIGCEKILSNQVVSAAGFNFEATVGADTECADGNGTISITVLEGTPPIQFQFMNEDWTTVSDFNSLQAGNYEILMKDADGCSVALSFSVEQGETGTSWSGTVLPIIETNCSQSGCHNGISRADLRSYDEAKFYAGQIKALTQDRSMPFEGSITQEEIDQIACWVDEGAKEN
jgi:hypothetical protein